MTQVLGERAKRRLKIAAALLRGSGRRPRDLGLSREGFYEGIQNLISTLTPEERQILKDLTDWVEVYDLATEAAAPDAPRDAKRRRPPPTDPAA